LDASGKIEIRGLQGFGSGSGGLREDFVEHKGDFEDGAILERCGVARSGHRRRIVKLRGANALTLPQPSPLDRVRRSSGELGRHWYFRNFDRIRFQQLALLIGTWDNFRIADHSGVS
jgi:hypothetical protein